MFVALTRVNGLLYIDLERVIPEAKNRAVSKSTNS